MRRWDFDTLRDAVSMTVGATYKQDLTDSGFCSGLLLHMTGTMVSNSTLSGGKWRLMDWLDPIKVIADGSREIVSLNAAQLQVVNFYELGMPPLGKWANYASQNQRETIFIPFGRYFGDEEYGLDLDRFDNVELQVTNDSSSTYHSAMDITIFQVLARGGNKPAARGYIKSVEHKSYQIDGSTIEYTELPTGNPLYSIYLRCLVDRDSNNIGEGGLDSAADNVKFALNDGGRVVYNNALSHLARFTWWDMVRFPLTFTFIDGTADKGFEIGWGRPYGFSGISGSKDDAVSSTIPTIDGDEQLNTAVFEAREADSPIHGMFSGIALHEAVPLHLTRKADLSDMLMPGQDLPAKIEVTSGASTAGDDTDHEVFYRQLVQ